MCDAQVWKIECVCLGDIYGYIIYTCVCVFVWRFCSELRSIATITATMLPVSPFYSMPRCAVIFVCVCVVCEQWLSHTFMCMYRYTHTHTHTHIEALSVRVQWQTQCSKRRAKFQRKLHAMRMCNSRVRSRPLQPSAFSLLPCSIYPFNPSHPLITLLSCAPVSHKTACYKWLISLFPVFPPSPLHACVCVCVIPFSFLSFLFFSSFVANFISLHFLHLLKPDCIV